MSKNNDNDTENNQSDQPTNLPDTSNDALNLPDIQNGVADSPPLPNQSLTDDSNGSSTTYAITESPLDSKKSPDDTDQKKVEDNDVGSTDAKEGISTNNKNKQTLLEGESIPSSSQFPLSTSESSSTQIVEAHTTTLDSDKIEDDHPTEAKQSDAPTSDVVNHQNGEIQQNTTVHLGADSPTVTYSSNDGTSTINNASDEEGLHDKTVEKSKSHPNGASEGPKPDEPKPAQIKPDEPPSDEYISGKNWFDLQFHDDNKEQIKKPDQIEKCMPTPPTTADEEDILDRIQGSMIGMALGDALGAHVEFRPRQFLVANPVADLQGGGTWGLNKGQFTDDTSMALCLANSLVACQGFVLYDQLVRYKWWYMHGYMSSTGQCFDIGNATRQSIVEFKDRQKDFALKHSIDIKKMDSLQDPDLLKEFNVYCSYDDVAGNGALMRLAPVPLFFYRFPEDAVEFSGKSGQITHGDQKAYDACRYYGALIVAALQGEKKDQLLDKNFYSTHKTWFGEKELHSDIQSIAEGSYQQIKGYDGGIRGKGYIVKALEAALWAFWSDEDSFEKGALAAVNLGDDTDTTAAIYGQLAGAYYGYKNLPEQWLEHVYAHEFLEKLSKWIAYEGKCWQKSEAMSVNQ